MLNKLNRNYEKEEFWKPINGYENAYEVSNFGRVRSLPRIVKGKGNSTQLRQGYILKFDESGRYRRVTLFYQNKRYRESVHRLVAEAFVDNHKNKPEVNHINGNKYDNHYTNLEWVTSSENQLHSFSNGLQRVLKGEETVNAKLKATQVIDIKKSPNDSKTRKKLAEQYGVSYATVYDIQTDRRWKHIKVGDIRGL